MASFEDDYLDLRAVCALLSAHPITCARWCREGRFRDTRRARDGRTWLVGRAEVVALLEDGKRRPPMLKEDVHHAG